jgi:hypothetical protein
VGNGEFCLRGFEFGMEICICLRTRWSSFFFGEGGSVAGPERGLWRVSLA